METVTVEMAQADWDQLLARVEAGETIVVARDGTPVAKIAPFSRRQPGLLKGKISIGPEFFDPLPEEELRGWE
jgi:antitoxin (DNA-binding transcriptional repressor) of toxin-antitoxin stability system